ncbi:hypothetical protein Q7P37_002582 [Cladosporium fusiforme]
MNSQYAQYGGQDAVNGAFPPNPFNTGPYQHQQSLPYPAVPAAQHQQHYYPQVAPTAAPQQHSQSGIHASAPSHQYPQPPVTSPSPAQNDPGAPLPDATSPTLSQYGDLTASLRQHEDTGAGDADDDGPQPDEHDGNEPIFHLPPPPEGTYPDVASMEEAIHSWSLEHGYELVRRASKKNAKGVLYKRYMHCSKHGKAANTGKLTDQTRVRHNRKSNRMNCPMSLAVVAVDPNNPGGEWQVRHRKTHHNHGPLDALNLTGHRRRARAGGIEQAVDGLFAIGTPTAQVLQFLQRTNPNGLFTRTDVANMKLKYKKFGTCLVKGDTASSGGRPCNLCRSRKIKCDNSRPSCGGCSQAGLDCEYDHDAEETMPPIPEMDGAMDASETIQMEQSPVNEVQHPQQDSHSSAGNRSRAGASQFQQNAQRAEEILANLQAFQTQHVTPVKLDLQSSAVEILAASSCGSGDSYRSVPLLQSPSDWPMYRDSMTEACMKENTFELLIGTKTEPTPPALDCKVEDWNEYIKKLAIFNRRNTALTGALWGTLAPTFRNRVQHIKNASDIWAVLENACLPQGSETGFNLYLDLHNITQANSKDLKDYIVRLENAYAALNQLSHHWRAQHDSPAARANNPGQSSAFSTINATHPSSTLPSVQPIFSEEMLCFLFLRNLAPDFKRWVESLCATNNVAGFGTGPRLGFVDLTRRAVEYDAGVRSRG